MNQKLALLLLTVAGTASSWAGLTATLDIYRTEASYYYFVSVATNATPPNAPPGDYLITSPQHPTNGTYQRFTLGAGGITGLGASATGTGSFDTFMDGLTNGQWRIVVTNAASTNTFFFTVSAPGYTSGHFPATVVTFPAADQINVTNRPTLAWTGPAGWLGTLNAQVYNSTFSFYESASLPPSATGWTPAGTLPGGTNYLYVYYRTNTTATITLSTPLDAGLNPLSAWTSASRIESYDAHAFRVGTPAPSGTTALFGHYRFNDSGNLRLDSSGLGNDATSLLYTGAGTQFPQYNPAGVDGGAIEFDGYNAMFWETGLTNVLTGSYSVSLWLKTTQTYGLDTDSALAGAGIMDASDPKPMVQTGGKLAFDTGYGAHTLRSSNSINSGAFNHLVVTRDAATGDKSIYVNGVLDAAAAGDAGFAPPSSQVRLGYSWSAPQGIEGVVDDLQVYTNALTSEQVQFLFDHPGLTAPAANVPGHTLEAHYAFDDSGWLGRDSSPNEWHINAGGSWGTPEHEPSTNAAAGAGAVEFFGVSSMDLPTNLFPVLAGSFSVSAWIKTAQVDGSDTDDGYEGAGVIWADLPGAAADVAPLALTGYKAAFFTGDPVAVAGDTLHSSADVSATGNYVHVVVTRDQTGEKRLYVNGVLDATGAGYGGMLDALTTSGDLRFGGVAGHAYEGLLDDVQFYAGVLDAAEVATLYASPGATLPNTSGDSELADAVDAPQLLWNTGGDAPWFRQTTETHDATDSAQSGAIDHDQQSWLETTVEGPGMVSFWWNVSSDDTDGYDHLELTVDGLSEAGISGEWGWDYREVYLGSGAHTLRWTYHKDGDFTAGQDAAWLDEVSFVPEIQVNLTLQIERNNDPANPGYYAYPTLDYYSPEPVTSHEVVSPTGRFGCYVDAVDNYPIYDSLPTWQAVRDELEAGSWTIYINRGHLTERQYTFTVTVDSLDATNLPAANVTSPTEWQTGIATNHTFAWTGPTNFDSLFLYSYVLNTGGASGGFTNLNVGGTSSRMPHPLAPGTNAVYVSYTATGFGGVTLSDPVDASFNPLSSWSYQVNLGSVQTRRFEVGSASPPAAPVQILNPLHTGTNFSLAFQTQSGRTHTVQSRTNLATAPWVDLTNFVGNGSLIQFFLPLADGPESYFRVGTQ